MAWWHAVEQGDWAEADRRTQLATAAMTDWERLWGPITASSALSKISTRTGILPRFPLRVRAPYLAGSDDDVNRLRDLLEASYPELVYRA